MIKIDEKLINDLFDKAVASERKRMHCDLRTSPNDGSQRMLNALLPGSIVPIHRHPKSNENVLLLCGKLVEVIYDADGNETERIHLDPSVGNFGCVVPAGAWHSVEVLEPSVIYEAKAGIAVGVDGIFMETHQNPSVAKSDGANMLPLAQVESLLEKLVRIRQAVL